MSSSFSPLGPVKTEQAFLESQKLPPAKRGMTFEALFFRQLHQVTARIHETENVEQIMLCLLYTSDAADE